MFDTIPLVSPRVVNQNLPLFSMPVNAGPPTPADDSIEERVDLTELLVRRPDSTFIVKVTGDSMSDASVSPGDMLIVDRALRPKHNDMVVALVNGEFTLKSFVETPALRLVSRNASKPVIVNNPFEVWGVVLWVVHKTR